MTEAERRDAMLRAQADATLDIHFAVGMSACPQRENVLQHRQSALTWHFCHADSLRQQLENRTHIVTQAEQRGEALRAQADAALNFKFAAGQAQDASMYAGASPKALPQDV